MGLNKRLIDQAGGAAGVTNTDNFEPVIYTGNNSTQSITSLDFQPDLVWIKGRDYSDSHALIDSVRGTNKLLFSNNTSQQGSYSNTLTSFDSNGFTLGADATQLVNYNTKTYVAWCWKAGGNSNTYNVDDTGYSTASDAGLSSANGTTLNGASVNTEAGFSIINYETNVNGDNRPAHGLTQEPELIIFKPYDTSSLGWYVMTKKIDGSVDFLFLNTNGAKTDAGNSEFIDSTHFRTSFGTSWGSVIAYCFHSVDGYQKIGSYTGTGSSGNAITGVGFEPRFLMMKATNANEDWVILDAARNTSDPRNTYIMANLSGAEFSNTPFNVNFDSDGFTINGTAVHINGSGTNYIYLAIA